MNEKAELRKDQIISTAIDILVKHGHGGLSVDKVAQTLGISKGNLTYHFPTKDQLVQAMFDRLIEDTQEMRTKVSTRHCTDPVEKFCRHIDFQLSLRRKPGYDAEVLETYAFSTHDKYVNTKVTEIIESWVQELTEIIGSARTDLSHMECRNRAIMINALLRGMILFTGASRGNKKQHAALTREARNTALMIAGLSPR